MPDLHFEVESSRIERTYGIMVTFAKCCLDESVQEDDIPYYLLVFEGPENHIALEDVTKAFGVCHQDAMESVGLAGIVTPETFESMLEESIELAGELMAKHDLKVLNVQDLDEHLVASLFEEAAGMIETDPKMLN